MSIRQGMWVTHSNHGIGILVALGPRAADPSRGEMELNGYQAEFHQVAEDGSTVLVVAVAQDDLAQARYREIPESRRAMTKEQFAARGYA